MKSIEHISLSLILSLCLPLTIYCQVPTITTSVDRNKILIGEQIRLNVQVTMPDNRYKLSWLTVPSDFGAFVVASRDKIDSGYQTGVLTFRQSLHITSFDSGRQVIQPLSFQFETLNGDSSFLMFTDSIPVNVLYSPADSVLPFHDIKPIINVSSDQPQWLLPVIIATILILLVLIYLYIRHRRKKKGGAITEPELSDYDEAMKLLNELKKEALPAHGQFKMFYLRLTEIFKRYISRKTGENKMYLTGDELIADLSHRELSRDMLSEFANCIRMGDAVKFAKYRPSIEESDRCLEKISGVINLLNNKEKEGSNDL